MADSPAEDPIRDNLNREVVKLLGRRQPYMTAERE
jgi:hypothetical protein